MSIVRASIIAGSILIAAANGTAPARAEGVAERREAAVRQARTGRPDEAIAILRAMLASGSDDGLVAMDLTALLQQAGRPDEAIAVFETAAAPLPPDYALLAAARAYRDLKRFDDAERLARAGQARFPDQPTWPLLLSLVLTDAGRAGDALYVLAQPTAMRGDPLDRLLAEGYARRRAGQPYPALTAYLKVLDLARNNVEARTAAATIMGELGGPYGAAALAGSASPYFADEAAAMVRWGTDTRPTDPARRFDGTDAAIARLDTLLAALPPGPAQAAQRRRLRLDRLTALRDRVRMTEVIPEAEALQAEAFLPPYAEEAYGDALLYLRRPQAAQAAYRRVLAAQPKSIDARYGLFFASAEAEDFATAYATIDALVQDQPIWRLYMDDPTRHADPARGYAEVAAANARHFGAQEAEAWKRITSIAAAAPANPWARLSVYEIANARGWPRRAEAEGQIAVALDPDSLGPQAALVEIDLANDRFAEARRRIAALQVQYPENLRVRRLARDISADLGWIFEAEAKPSASEGGGTNASGEALTAQTKLTTPPLADRWRLYAVLDHANAHPPEGYAERSRLSTGLEWRSRDLTATVYGGSSWGSTAKPSLGGTLDWSVSDQLRLAVAAEQYAWDTPLRAVLHGITADFVAASATWRWSESRELRGAVSYTPFSDGNRRLGAGLDFDQLVVALPRFELTAGGEVYASQNNRPEAPYFNPDGDLTVMARLLAQHVLWRRYDTALTQILTVDAGLYAQAHHASDLIARASYEHRWRFDPRLEFHYGVQLSRSVYDGDVEKTAALTVGLKGRF